MNENELISLGVSKEHIQWLKNTKVESKPENEDCYVAEEPTIMKLVPVSHIVGLGMRAENNESWWDHYVGAKGNLRRTSTLVNSLKSKGLSTFIDTFQNKQFSHELKIEYYTELNKYFTIAGQHRTTMAKVVNAPNILAEVSIMRLDKEKQAIYEKKKNLKEKIFELLE